MSLPPDLRVLCRLLTSTSPTHLPNLSSLLQSHVLRCGRQLSAPQEQKGSEKTSESALLIHKLKTHISSLLNGKSPQGRFAAIVLVKAVVDVGGWECLRGAEPWVRGLLSTLQKPDPPATKELCVVALTRIYSLLSAYPTLVREITTPTLPTFTTACLQLLKPSASSKRQRTPLTLVETITSALAVLLPLYPTTLRPFVSQIRSAVRPFTAPTCSDEVAVPRSLQKSSRHLVAVLPFTAAKNGTAEEWAKEVASLVEKSHGTADHVFRAVLESWESTAGYVSETVSFDGQPHGGADSAAGFPVWAGVRAGSERLAGFVALIADYLRYPTKTPVTVPVGTLVDLLSRLTLVTPPKHSAVDADDDIQLNPNIGREEKDELWSALPDIHLASLTLCLTLVRRLRENILPFAIQILDLVVRIFKATGHVPLVRRHAFGLAREVIFFNGHSLPRTAVDSLDPIICSSCRDLQAAAGFGNDKKSQESMVKDSEKPKGASMDADAFLGARTATLASVHLPPDHVKAAEGALEAFYSYLPPRHLKKTIRQLMDQTAILANSKGAMLASVLHPYQDRTGKQFANILPFVAQQFPDEPGLEVLRSNLRSDRGTVTTDFQSAEAINSDEEVEEEANGSAPLPAEPALLHTSGLSGENGLGLLKKATTHIRESNVLLGSEPMTIDNPFLSTKTEKTVVQEHRHSDLIDSLKRKSEEPEIRPPKRVDFGKIDDLPRITEQLKADDRSEKDSSDEESVHLNMDIGDFTESSEEED